MVAAGAPSCGVKVVKLKEVARTWLEEQKVEQFE